MKMIKCYDEYENFEYYKNCENIDFASWEIIENEYGDKVVIFFFVLKNEEEKHIFHSYHHDELFIDDEENEKAFDAVFKKNFF